MVYRFRFLKQWTADARQPATSRSESSAADRRAYRRLLLRRESARILKEALITLVGAGVAISVVLALVPDAVTDDSFFGRIGCNLKTFVGLLTLQYNEPTVYENDPVLGVLFNRGMKSFTLILGALAITMVLGISTGLLLARKPHNSLVKAWAWIISAISAMPVLVLGILLIVLASAFFGISPFLEILDKANPLDRPSLGEYLLVYLLPMATLAFGDGMLHDVIRAVNLETRRLLEQDYLRAARARNVSLWPHLRKGLTAPVIAVLAGKVTYLIGGSVVVEWIFAWQGLAYQVMFVLTRAPRDIPFILAATVLLVGLIVLVNLISEIITLRSDPRLARKPSGQPVIQEVS